MPLHQGFSPRESRAVLTAVDESAFGFSKLRRAQRSLHRKQRDSNNRRKALLRVQRLQEHTANQRRDDAHKLARQLVNGYDRIALEDLRLKNNGSQPPFEQKHSG